MKGSKLYGNLALNVNQHPQTFKKLKFSHDLHKMNKDDAHTTLMKNYTTVMKKQCTMNLPHKNCYSFWKTPNKVGMKNNN